MTGGRSSKERDRAVERADRVVQVASAQVTGGLSPVSLALAGLDWALHLARSPARTAQLGTRAAALAGSALLGVQPRAAAGDAPGWSATDSRFAHPAWRAWPWSALVAGQHASETWWQEAVDLPGMERHHREVCASVARQWLDLTSPSNNALLNPEVVERTLAEGGANLLRGWQQAVANGVAGARPRRTRAFEPGQQVAVTPGRVVYRNRLVELLQYEPATDRVAAEPVFIVPSWIMKYYILDLSPTNSFVRYLVEQGHTVFIVSWHNPTRADAQLTMEDYLQLGVYQPLAEIARSIPDERVHAAGYCLGGTLLAVAAAALERPGGVALSDELPELASVTLLASETDFSEPGELGLFIDEAQIRLLDELMAERGFLTGRQMADSFTYLHARDLVWSKYVSEILLGEPRSPNDLMSWNADVTRMPARMHSEYLRRCYLRNEIAEDRFPVEGRAVALSDLHVPMFVVGTQTDHVSPWRSVYKIHRLADTEITFVLTSGGHNAGIVSEPGHPRRHFASLRREPDGLWVSPEDWLLAADQHTGSWWPHWHAWLAERGSGETVAARQPAGDARLEPAPGRYVHECYAD